MRRILEVFEHLGKGDRIVLAGRRGEQVGKLERDLVRRAERRERRLSAGDAGVANVPSVRAAAIGGNSREVQEKPVTRPDLQMTKLRGVARNEDVLIER